MRRSLALCDETARHPFLADLPPHVRHVEHEGPGKAPRRPWRIGAQDVKEFLLAYCACFMAVSIFIA